MQTYSNLLKNYILESGMTLDQISDACEKRGVKIHPTYISKLRLGKRSAPSEDISRVLAEVTGGDPEALIKAGHYEKAPQEIKDSLKKANVYENFVDYLKREKPIQGNEVENPNTVEYLKSLSDNALDELLGDLVNSFVKESIAPYNHEEMLRIPVLGYIRAGAPIDRIEYNEGYTLVDPDLLRGKEGFALRVKGDSMSGDRILDGDTVIVVKQEEVTPGDIAVVAVNGDWATLKRVKCLGDMCMLIPSNPKMEPQLVAASDIHIIGKVVEVKFTL